MIIGGDPGGNRSQVDRAPRVFVSYAHDTEHHKAQVLQFCQLLRDNGIAATLDRYESNDRQDWYEWMISQVKEAHYVVVIASPRYRAVGDGNAPADRNRGVQAEVALLRDLLYADRPTWTRRLLPVVLPGASIDHIPYFLQPYCASRYVIAELSVQGIEDLLRVLTGQPAYPRTDLGSIPELPPESGRDDTDASDQTQPGQTRPGRTDHHPMGPVTMTATTADSSRVYQAGRDQHITEG
ncbi:MAG TPA: toll/interleukin-1 receptor domain-containing protein [Amycolatopsis sp.]|uniref:toll/interleukin-1 receptor domain-containing protein n=1 Tax=Amycolatopsis sp. TaxID=37632 RepID=UPI002B4A7063|nr:toll/interleukin-1 receptor domain-containing protein [Amycolatopsis sp.]HKS49848.1 toll/interleukin-1 receptor domain-containing protein [Amycolatopsis sp.]